MFKSFIKLAFVAFMGFTSLGFADCNKCFGDCCQSLEFGVGWRRDNLDWKLRHLHFHKCSVRADASSRIRFKEIDMYTGYGKLRWMGERYYVRLAGQYGLTEKGRAKEHFKIHSSILDRFVHVCTNDPIKRRSEVYDFNGAVGYPFMLCCERLVAVPVIGFSFHRQRLRVKEDEESCSPSYCSSSSSCCSSSSSSSCSSSNPFLFSESSDPFSYGSDPRIASALGLSVHHRTSNFRFTWYGFYVGTDISYALDPCWTLFTELEWHFSDQCHRKRDSHTGVEFVDRHHHKDWASGFNGVFGAIWDVGSCWYASLTIDYKWWTSHSHHDTLQWQSVGLNAALGYVF